MSYRGRWGVVTPANHYDPSFLIHCVTWWHCRVVTQSIADLPHGVGAYVAGLARAPEPELGSEHDTPCQAEGGGADGCSTQGSLHTGHDTPC